MIRRTSRLGAGTAAAFLTENYDMSRVDPSTRARRILENPVVPQEVQLVPVGQVVPVGGNAELLPVVPYLAGSANEETEEPPAVNGTNRVDGASASPFPAIQHVESVEARDIVNANSTPLDIKFVHVLGSPGRLVSHGISPAGSILPAFFPLSPVARLCSHEEGEAAIAELEDISQQAARVGVVPQQGVAPQLPVRNNHEAYESKQLEEINGNDSSETVVKEVSDSIVGMRPLLQKDIDEIAEGGPPCDNEPLSKDASSPQDDSHTSKPIVEFESVKGLMSETTASETKYIQAKNTSETSPQIATPIKVTDTYSFLMDGGSEPEYILESKNLSPDKKMFSSTVCNQGPTAKPYAVDRYSESQIDSSHLHAQMAKELQFSSSKGAALDMLRQVPRRVADRLSNEMHGFQNFDFNCLGAGLHQKEVKFSGYNIGPNIYHQNLSYAVDGATSRMEFNPVHARIMPNELNASSGFAALDNPHQGTTNHLGARYSDDVSISKMIPTTFMSEGSSSARESAPNFAMENPSRKRPFSEESGAPFEDGNEDYFERVFVHKSMKSKKGPADSQPSLHE